MELLKTTVLIVCSLLTLFAEGNCSQTDKCTSLQRLTKERRIDLCHDNPRPKNDGPFKCYSPDYGFVLINFKIAPRSEFADCGQFFTPNHLDAKCLRNEVDNVDQFDASVFDLLEKVSGKNEIDNNTVVDRFSWSTTPEEGGTNDSSAFVSFQNLCKPAVRSSGKTDKQVVRMCSTDRVSNSIVTLTLQGIDSGQLPDGPFRCRCTITPSHSLTIKALDIRLQHNRACSPDVTGLKMYSGNQTFQDLRCDGLSAHYGMEEMLTTDREVTLDLTASNRAFPTAVWLQGVSKEGSSSSLENVIVACNGVTPLGNQDLTTPGNEEKDKGTDNDMITGLVVGGIVICAVVVIIIIIIIIVRRRFIQKSKRRQPNLQSAAEDYDSDVSHEYAAIEECANPKVSSTISEQKAPTLPPNHPRRQSEVECGPTEEGGRLSEKDRRRSDVECGPTEEGGRLSEKDRRQSDVECRPTEEGRRWSERDHKLSEVNPVSKPPRSYSYSQDSANDKEGAVPDEEYDRLMHQGSSGRKKDARGDNQKSSSNRKKDNYHHLDLDNNSAETEPLQLQKK